MRHAKRSFQARQLPAPVRARLQARRRPSPRRPGRRVNCPALHWSGLYLFGHQHWRPHGDIAAGCPLRHKTHSRRLPAVALRAMRHFCLATTRPRAHGHLLIGTRHLSLASCLCSAYEPRTTDSPTPALSYLSLGLGATDSASRTRTPHTEHHRGRAPQPGLAPQPPKRPHQLTVMRAGVAVPFQCRGWSWSAGLVGRVVCHGPRVQERAAALVVMALDAIAIATRIERS